VAIVASLGTPWEIDTRGRILFLEDIDEAPYRIDRMLNQLRIAGKFRESAGIVLGAWTRCEPAQGKRSLSLEQIFADLLVPAGKPVLSGLQAGHCEPTLSVPLGVRCAIDSGRHRFEALESLFLP
jgi:muramoyltetrapeptide carboxypeptidase